jgi:hypothetical protein
MRDPATVAQTPETTAVAAIVCRKKEFKNENEIIFRQRTTGKKKFKHDNEIIFRQRITDVPVACGLPPATASTRPIDCRPPN